MPVFVFFSPIKKNKKVLPHANIWNACDRLFFFFVGKKELLLFPERKNGTKVIDLDFKV